MCGIAGGWWKRDDLTDSRLDRALEKIRYRGPDDRGCEQYRIEDTVVALGHTRLSILDLSVAGHQPMLSADKRFSIVFNGEVYNYRELRAELQALGHRFVSDSDTEVLLAAWIQWGRSCLPRLVGMFAFAVLDQAAGTLTCVRDGFGIKPFFYAAYDCEFYFASEVPALNELLPKKPSLDWQRAYDYLVHGDYDSGPRTFFEGVTHLLPGHLLIIDLRAREVGRQERWWVPSIVECSDLSFADATELVREQFLQNIRLHLRSDVTLGAALSGGIDSSAVVCAMRHVEPDLPLHTFSYIAAGSKMSEEIWVDRINAHVSAVPHKISVGSDELLRDLDSMILAQGEPFGSTSIYAQYRVFQLARESGVAVTLDGQGADEMLAGYNGYPGQRLLSLLEKGRMGDAWDFLNQWSRWPGRTRKQGIQLLMAEFVQGPLYNALRRLSGRSESPEWLNEGALEERGVVRCYPRQRSDTPEEGRRVIAELALSLTRRGLPALLRHGDRSSMRFSVESRVPFLTLDMADLLLSMPESYLISPQGETKRIFRAAMRGIVPDDVLDRRDKIGFSTPEQVWLSSMVQTAQGWLRDSSDLPFIKKDVMLKEFRRIVSGERAFSSQAWRWINFARWHDHFLT